MYVQLHNEYYGYSTATYGDYVAVGNPASLRYTASLPTAYHSGSVDVYRYNKTTDQHDLVKTLYVHESTFEILLARETGSDSSVRDPLHTEVTGVVFTTMDKDISLDRGTYMTSLEDGYGLALDEFQKILAVGCPYYKIQFKTSDITLLAESSSVDIYDFSKIEPDTGSDPYVYTLLNPDIAESESFGRAVGINNRWLAVGSPYVSSSNGMVYIYENLSTGSNHYSWSLVQRIESPDNIAGQMFGASVKLNKENGTYSGSMIVGCGLTSSNRAYYYEYSASHWTSSYTFRPTADIKPLTFGEGKYYPFQTTMSLSSSYGFDVSLYGTTVAIGSYHDRDLFEYTGSPMFQQGAFYIYELCQGVKPTDFVLKLKTNGPASILKNNRLGFSVDVYNNYAIAGSPKVETLDPCDIKGTLNQLYYCNEEEEFKYNGQFLLCERTTSSLDWDIVNIYSKRKRFLSPHRSFGYDVSIDGRSIVVGAPIILSGSARKIDIDYTASNGIEMDDISGKAYIYNLANLKEEWHVGNVFYRNGKIILMTSGSAFNGLFLTPEAYRPYQYDLTFQAQRTIQEKQILCNVEPGEFNVSTNPTAITKASSSLDLNKNGTFDFQDLDILMRYMQYRVDGTLDWSSSLVTADDEISLYKWNEAQWTSTSSLWSSSFTRFENTDTAFIDALDINHDNKVDVSDMKILWNYFSNRLTDNLYANYLNINCRRTTVSQAIEYLDGLTKLKETPQISVGFFDYDSLSATDRTGSFLAPMVTAIGLYSGLDLVAVAKLGNPIKLPKTLPINFVVKMDF